MGLGKLLKEKHIKQEWLAKKINVSQSTISLWISKKTYPTLEKIPKIAEALGLSIFECIDLFLTKESISYAKAN